MEVGALNKNVNFLGYGDESTLWGRQEYPNPPFTLENGHYTKGSVFY